MGAVGSGTPEIHRLTAWGQWAVGLLQHTATHCLTAQGRWEEETLQRTASLPGGIEQWRSCNAVSHCKGAVGGGTSATHCLTAWGQWAAQVLQRTASVQGGSGKCTSYNALPLVTWHQSKNPHDGSCRTDCLHALPRSKPVVYRRDSRATT